LKEKRPIEDIMIRSKDTNFKEKRPIEDIMIKSKDTNFK
jgi:hypothetical protein